MRFYKKCLSVAAALMGGVVLFSACSKSSSDTSQETDQVISSTQDEHIEEEHIEIEEIGLNFPYELENGKLLVNSLFQSSIINPDCGGESGENIATLEILNTSDEFLKEAKVTVKMTDGTEIPFIITNIPAGKKVWAFATDNSAIELNPSCEKINCESEFLDVLPVMADSLNYEVDETTVTLNNLTEESLAGLTIGCHCLFDDVYFGGLTYSYKVDELSANSSITVDADDCYLGSAEVVYITQNN